MSRQIYARRGETYRALTDVGVALFNERTALAHAERTQIRRGAINRALADAGLYRLLGDSCQSSAVSRPSPERATDGWDNIPDPQALFEPRSNHRSSETRDARRDRFARNSRLATQNSFVKHPRWLVGTALGIAALVALVSPVFATGRSSGSVLRLSPSGDWRLATGTGFASAPLANSNALIIDASTPSQDPAPQPEPQNAIETQHSALSTQHSYEVTGPPSLTVDRIESVLRQYGSPAVGHGQALYDLGVRYGINPAYALAFFVHESGCGTQGVARSSRSIGNIRWTPGYNSYEGYRSYDSWEQGMEDWYKLISDLYIQGWGLRTVDSIIPVYAPYGDNNHPPTYITAVKRMVDEWR